MGYPVLNMINTPSTFQRPVVIIHLKCSNQFWPIKLLPIVDKIMEIIVCNQLGQYFEKNALFYVGHAEFKNLHWSEWQFIPYVCQVRRKILVRMKQFLHFFVDLQRALLWSGLNWFRWKVSKNYTNVNYQLSTEN